MSGSAVEMTASEFAKQGAIAQLGYESVAIAQPSMLLGGRAALGQPARSSEE